jgi:hypothetical protein
VFFGSIVIVSGLTSAQGRDVTHRQRYLLRSISSAFCGSGRSTGAEFSVPFWVTWWLSCGAPLMMVSSDGSTRSASPDPKNAFILSIIVPFHD